MDINAFIGKWSRSQLSERAASQEHFIDLCRLLGGKTPAEIDRHMAQEPSENGLGDS